MEVAVRAAPTAEVAVQVVLMAEVVAAAAVPVAVAEVAEAVPEVVAEAEAEASADNKKRTSCEGCSFWLACAETSAKTHLFNALTLYRIGLSAADNTYFSVKQNLPALGIRIRNNRLVYVPGRRFDSFAPL